MLDQERKENMTPEDVKYLIEAFNSAASHQAKLIILSLVPEHFNKNEICDFFSCSEHLFRKARRVKKMYGVATAEPRKKLFRSRLDMAQAEHFLDFILSNGFLQDVAYGTTKLQLHSGEMIEIPHVVRTSLKTHIVSVYLKYCEKHYSENPLSSSLLLRIFENCKASQRKQLTGIDNYTADGIEGFRLLDALLEKINDTAENKERLRSSKKAALVYLKGDYKSHVSQLESQIPTHCRIHSLSNPKVADLKSECSHSHNDVCQECENVFQCLDSFYKSVLKTTDLTE